MTAKNKADTSSMREVRKLKEPQREAEQPDRHCGVLMKKFQSPNLTTGGLNVVLSCDRCGHQKKLPQVGGHQPAHPLRSGEGIS